MNMDEEKQITQDSSRLPRDHGTKVRMILGLVIGLAAVSFYLLFIFGEGVPKGFALAQANVRDFFGVIVFFLSVVLALVGCILSWWKTKMAGTLLIVSFLGFAVLSFLVGGFSQNPWVWLLFGFPFLLSGSLFLSISRKSLK